MLLNREPRKARGVSSLTHLVYVINHSQTGQSAWQHLLNEILVLTPTPVFLTSASPPLLTTCCVVSLGSGSQPGLHLHP